MATALATKPSTPRLSEVARHVIIPEGITSTGWPAVEAKCREFGDVFDPWQQGAGRLILAKRADGSYAATIGGVTLSIPRQVAKTFLVGRIVFALCVLFPGLRVIWTAHRTRTATNTFKTLQGYARRANVAPHIADIRRTNGEQEILFTNGSIIMFGAREAGFGRGFDEVDVEVFDEAQILTEKALEDMVAATNQSRHPHGALLFFMGTPPRPVDPGEAFTIRRDEALAHKPDLSAFGELVVGDEQLYIECSAEPDADPDDRKQWAIANPSFPNRTPLRSMLRLRKNLPSDESWRREALGIWDAPDDAEDRWQVVSAEQWAARLVPEATPTGTLAWAVDVAPDGRSTAIACSNGTYVEVVDHRPGMAWAPERLADLKQKYTVGQFFLDATGPAGSLIEQLDNLKIPYRKVTIHEHHQACGAFLDAVAGDNPDLIHRGQPPLDGAVEVAQRRHLTDVWLWTRSKSSGDISPLVAVTLARWAAETQKPKGSSFFL